MFAVTAILCWGRFAGLVVVLCLASLAWGQNPSPQLFKEVASPADRGGGAEEEAIEIPAHLKSHLTPELVAIFEPGAVGVPAGGDYDQLEYQLFRPVAASPSGQERYPLLVFFNGHGKVQMNNGNIGPLKHLQATIFNDPQQPEKYPFYLLAIRCPVDEKGKWLRWFGDSSAHSIEPIEAAMQVVDQLLEQHPIDEDRVSLVGISSGGSACWELAMRYPERFAAMVPTGSAGGDVGRIDRIRELPVWAFHSDGDKPERVQQTVQQLRHAGGNVHLTLIPSEKHACWNQAFQDYGALEWILAQSRGSTPFWRPADWHKTARWQTVKHGYLTAQARQRIWNDSWPRALPLLTVAAFVVLFRREVRARKKRQAESASGLPKTDLQSPLEEELKDETDANESIAVR